MPIVHFSHRREDIPADAINLRETTTQVTDWETKKPKTVPMWLWNSHVGLCIQERERNMHDDSDFFMLVWDAEKKVEWCEEPGAPVEIMFATTRGWSYPRLASSVDATPEVRALFEKYTERTRRHFKALGLCERRKFAKQVREECGLSWSEYKRLRFAVGLVGARDEIPEGYRTLLRSEHAGRLRSKFRMSLAAQVRKWLADPSPAYATPLSPKQANYLFQGD